VISFAERPGTALVLGASGGIGAAVAKGLLARGSRVALGYRRTEPDADHPYATAHHVDLADADSCAELMETVAAQGLHTLVYAAGPHVPMRHLSGVEPAEFAQQLEADAVAFFNAVRPALPHLRTARGNVVAVTTAATARFPVRDGLSSAPKAAVEALVRALAVEEGRYGVRFNAVGPGMLGDGMARRLIDSGDLDERALAVATANIPLRRFGAAADVANAVCFLASDEAGFITGQKLDVDGGYTA
jgi:NAD(P)-dependent dehydrogenase (short-subunit alcohol dehydrogenase family)